jgi:small GTP-binding protein
MLKKKICMVGAFSVGKTSLVQRFVKSIFSDAYLTTVGVKIDKKSVDVNGTPVELLLWDIQGKDELNEIKLNYLKGASGLLLVVDGTRGATLETALAIKAAAEASQAPVPAIMLFNKCDLVREWEVTDDMIAGVAARGLPTLRTSAKDGIGVEEAFVSLTRLMLA